MKVLILAGGFGTRLSEETDLIPKPLVKIGEKPILWHIMKHYSAFGFNEFVILLGYKGHMIKEYFANNNENNWDITFLDAKNKAKRLNAHPNGFEILMMGIINISNRIGTTVEWCSNKND